MEHSTIIGRAVVCKYFGQQEFWPTANTKSAALGGGLEKVNFCCRYF
jgi:hypothetical protein